MGERPECYRMPSKKKENFSAFLLRELDDEGFGSIPNNDISFHLNQRR
jgi:hypothetical protein